MRGRFESGLAVLGASVVVTTTVSGGPAGMTEVTVEAGRVSKLV